MSEQTISFTALDPSQEFQSGDSIGAAVVAAAHEPLLPDEILVISHKSVSKAEGRTRLLGDVVPGEEAMRIAAAQDRDPRHVQVILDETEQILRDEHGVLICVTKHGFVCANAGVDASNTAGSDEVVLLPLDPDASAVRIRNEIRDASGTAPAVVITDSFGRAWRVAQVDVAIGCAGISPIEDWRGKLDRAGRELAATEIAIADAVAAAADLARSKDSGQPFVRVSGLGRYVTKADGPGAQVLLRQAHQDLFRR
ncbi:MAG: coenzyme F420-0:L-glutamate ligase [Solirubrobacterales bacterium]|nr:coenzyme F420-0:L-glutamate ligase [Solirubrobacterales bacterium]